MKGAGQGGYPFFSINTTGESAVRKIKIHNDALNPVYLPYLTLEKRIQIFFGGSSSGKSVFLATRCVLDCMQGRNYLVTRKVGRTLRGSCWNECVKAINRLGLAPYFSINKSDMTLTSVENGAQILFAGLDDVEKIKSITPQNGPLTDIWMEEATEDDYQDYKQLEKRLRGHTKHKKRLIISFNPIYKTHWLYLEFFKEWADETHAFENDTLSILKTTYKDNHFLTKDDVVALENEKDEYYRNVYTLGNWGVVGDVIFTNWRMEDLSELAKTADKLYYGLDFGFSSDPCAVVKVHYERKRKIIYILGEFVMRGLTNDLLAKEMETFAKGAYITCDSAEPKSISELKKYGLRALPAKKGQDSVMHGLQWLKQHAIVVDLGCLEMKKELTLYQWQKDKNGNSLRQPEDKNNHLIDALRYALERESLGKVARTA